MCSYCNLELNMDDGDISYAGECLLLTLVKGEKNLQV